MDLLDSRNQRHTRFQKTQNEGQNLYTKIYEMLIKKKYAKAEELMVSTFCVIHFLEKQCSPGLS